MNTFFIEVFSHPFLGNVIAFAFIEFSQIREAQSAIEHTVSTSSIIATGKLIHTTGPNNMARQNLTGSTKGSPRN